MEEPARKAARERKPVRYWIHDLEDTPEAKKAACEFLRTIDGDSRHALMTPEELKRRTFKKLRAMQQKWDLIVTMDTGGSKSYPQHELKEFSQNVIQLPYTMQHYESTRSYKSWARRLKDALSFVKKKSPNVLVLESDVGVQGWSLSKLADVRRAIESRGGKPTVVAGLVNKQLPDMGVIDAAAVRWANYGETAFLPTRITELYSKFEEKKLANRVNPKDKAATGRAFERLRYFYGRRPGIPMVVDKR